MVYGNAVHKAAEEYGRDGVPIPQKFIYIKQYVDTLIEAPGDKYYEHKMGLTRELEPCEFLAGHVWWRGIADFMAVNGKEAILVDYKTGKSARYADTAQLELLALSVFAHFPHVEIVRAGLLFVVSKEFIQKKHTVDMKLEYLEPQIQQLSRLEAALENGTWNPVTSGLCKFCPVFSCEHNPKGLDHALRQQT